MNPWKQFQDLLPKDPKTIGTVLGHVAERHSIELLDGSVVEAVSPVAYPNGTRVFVQSGLIEGTAPTLPFVVMDV